MCKRITLLLLALACSTTAVSAPAAPSTQPAQQQVIPEGVKVERDIEYVAGGVPAQSLDLYLPVKPGDKPQPLLVWIHGGGWYRGSKDTCRFLPMVNRGYLVASVEYRFSTVALFPAQIQDCQAAIRWLRANATKYNIDPNRVGVGGDSAGGHLVALLGSTGGKKAFPIVGGNENQSDRVQAVCDFFGPSDFNTVKAQAAADPNVKSRVQWDTPKDAYSLLIGVKLGESKEKELAVSPVHYVSQESAPTLILHGTADASVPFAQSEELAEALKKAGVSVIVQKFPGVGHGGPQFALPVIDDLIVSFFDKYLKGKDVNVEPLPEAAVMLKPTAAPRK